MSATSSLKTYYINISSGKKYPIIFGDNAIAGMSSNDISMATKALIVTNTTIAKECEGYIRSVMSTIDLDLDILQLEDGESVKSMDSVMTIVDHCLKHKMGRKDVIFALGGGVVGDMAGFAASIYLRGIPFFNCLQVYWLRLMRQLVEKQGLTILQVKTLLVHFISL